MTAKKPMTASRRRRRAPANPPAPAHDLDGMLKRLHLPTVRRLYAELATRAESEGMSYRTYLETLVAEEIAHRAETRLTRAVRKARFPFVRTIDDFNFTFQTTLKLADARELSRTMYGRANLDLLRFRMLAAG